MRSNEKRNALIFGVIGLVLDVVAFFLMSIFAVGGIILGVLGIINANKAKNNKEESTLELILSIISLILGAIFILLWLISIILNISIISSLIH